MTRFLFIPFLVLSSTAFGATEMTIELWLRTNLDVTALSRIEVNGTNIHFNSVKVDSVLIPRISSAIGVLSRVEREASFEPCMAGTFTHIVKQKRTKTEESGCLDGERADILFNALDYFKKGIGY